MHNYLEELREDLRKKAAKLGNDYKEKIIIAFVGFDGEILPSDINLIVDALEESSGGDTIKIAAKITAISDNQEYIKDVKKKLESGVFGDVALKSCTPIESEKFYDIFDHWVKFNYLFITKSKEPKKETSKRDPKAADAVLRRLTSGY